MRKIIITIFVFILLIASAFFSIRFLIDYKNDKTTANGEPSELISLDLEKDNEYYTIKYNLDDGIIQDNPTKYNLFTETFTLNNPIKEGYDFIGWTGTDLNEPKLQVTICKGSSGDLEFTANYKLILNAPTISKQGSIISWPAVDNAETYMFYVNDYGTGVHETSVDLRDYSYHFVKGANSVKVQAISAFDSLLGTELRSKYSNIITFYSEVENLEAPILSVDGDICSFNSVLNAYDYDLKINSTIFSSFKPNGDGYLDNYSFSISIYESYLNLTQNSISVRAHVKIYGEDLYSDFSSPIIYESTSSIPKLDTPEIISGESNVITWRTVPNATYYNILVNGATRWVKDDEGTGSETLSIDLTNTLNLPLGLTSYAVVACGSNYLASDPSNIISVESSELSAPDLSYSNDNNYVKCKHCGTKHRTVYFESYYYCSNCGKGLSISWDKVNNADYYMVCIGLVFEGEDGHDDFKTVVKFKTTSNSLCLSDYANYYSSGCRYELYVLAYSNSLKYHRSGTLYPGVSFKA